MHNIITYGSLRKGEYNFNSFPSAKHIKTTTIKGWDLYSLGPYPGVKPGEGTLTVDVIQVNNKDYEYIRNMELGAGYDEIDIKVEDVEGKFYPFNGIVNQENLVENGDWLSRKN